MKFFNNSVKLVLLVTLAVFFSLSQVSAEWYPYTVQVWDPPFDLNSPRSELKYVPLEKATKKWNICVSFPHMKDAYWMAVNYGVVDESRRMGVSMQLLEAGGYVNLNKQISQIEDCIESGSDAVVIGAISYEGLNNLVSEIRKKGIPVIDVINGMSSKELSAKSLVSFGEMGSKAGEYLVQNIQKAVKLSMLPGFQVLQGLVGWKPAIRVFRKQ